MFSCLQMCCLPCQSMRWPMALAHWQEYCSWTAALNCLVDGWCNAVLLLACSWAVSPSSMSWSMALAHWQRHLPWTAVLDFLAAGLCQAGLVSVCSWAVPSSSMSWHVALAQWQACWSWAVFLNLCVDGWCSAGLMHWSWALLHAFIVDPKLLHNDRNHEADQLLFTCWLLLGVVLRCVSDLCAQLLAGCRVIDCCCRLHDTLLGTSTSRQLVTSCACEWFPQNKVMHFIGLGVYTSSYFLTSHLHHTLLSNIVCSCSSDCASTIAFELKHAFL